MSIIGLRANLAGAHLAPAYLGLALHEAMRAAYSIVNTTIEAVSNAMNSSAYPTRLSSVSAIITATLAEMSATMNTWNAFDFQSSAPSSTPCSRARTAPARRWGAGAGAGAGADPPAPASPSAPPSPPPAMRRYIHFLRLNHRTISADMTPMTPSMPK